MMISSDSESDHRMTVVLVPCPVHTKTYNHDPDFSSSESSPGRRWPRSEPSQPGGRALPDSDARASQPPESLRDGPSPPGPGPGPPLHPA